MKKHIIILVAFIILLTLSLSGCGGEHEHSIVIEPKIPATDTTDGLSEKQYCSTCGEIIKKAKKLPATLQGTDIKAPTFTVYGDNLYLEIPEDISVINFKDKILTNDKSHWVLSLDEFGLETVDSKTVTLSSGENRFYVIVTDKNDNVKKYNVIITTVNSAQLAFDANGGTLIGEVPAEYTTKAALALPSASLPYYTFKGWSLNADGSGTLYTELPAGLALTEEQIELGLTLYAVWERQSGFIETGATINYELAGGINEETAPTRYSYGFELTLPTPTKQYCEFQGWTLNGEKVTKISENQRGDVTLVANWKQIYTPIIFNLVIDGAQLPNARDTFLTAEGIDNLLHFDYIPVCDGYIFAGWYADTSYTAPVDSIAPNTTEPLTIYAKWEKLPEIGGGSIGW